MEECNSNYIPELPQNLSGCLTVGNLHPQVNEELLYKRFILFGNIQSVRVFREIRSVYSRGTGYVNFENVAEAELAMDMLMFKPLFGRPMQIMWYQCDPLLHHRGIGNLYIKNLASDIRNTDLHNMFSVIGEVQNCRIATDRFGSNRYGFVQFKTIEEAWKAIHTMHRMTLNGKKISVTHYKSYTEFQAEMLAKKEKSGCKSLFVSNLPYSFNGKQLARLFFSFGTVKHATVIKENNCSKVFGFVAFKHREDAERALAEMNGRWVGTKKLFVAPSYRMKIKMQDQPESTLTAEKLSSRQKRAYANILLEIQSSTLQDVKAILLHRIKFKRVISTAQLERCRTALLPMLDQPFSPLALYLGNFDDSVHKTRPVMTRRTSFHINQLLWFKLSTTQNAASYRGNNNQLMIPVHLLNTINSLINQMADLSPDPTNQVTVVQERVLRANLPALSSSPAQQNAVALFRHKALQNMVNLYTKKPPFKRKDKKSEPCLWEKVKSNLVLAVSSPLACTIIGVFVIMQLVRRHKW